MERHISITVASMANTGLSISRSKLLSLRYNDLASLMSIQAKSAKMRQALFSFAFDKVLFTMASPMPIWYNLFALTFKRRIVSDRLSRCVNGPKTIQRDARQQLKCLALQSALYRFSQVL